MARRSSADPRVAPPTPVGRDRHHVLAAFSGPGFRRLFSVRMACQFGDGMFQAGLAGAVLFSPEREAHPAQIAAGFAVLLLPYSLVGPFAGVLLDRWRRQRVLVRANLARAVAVLFVAAEIAGGLSGWVFYASALVVISLSRFILSALSAALPRVVAPAELVTVNALSTTSGTVIGAAGGAVALGARALLGDLDAAYALIAAPAVIPYLIAATYAAGFNRDALGPSAAERQARETLADVARGLVHGARHIAGIAPVRNGLVAIGLQRLGYGVSTVCTLLLYRHYFHDDGFLRSGLAGLSQVVAAVAAGGALAAATTPLAFRHFGAVRWPTGLLAAAAVVQITLGLPFTMPAMLVAALLLGYIAQSVKISVDTLVQLHVEDEYRGRVFALYDTTFNVALVCAAVLTALVLPVDGHSPASVVVIGVGYALTAVGYFTAARRTTPAIR